MEFDPCLFVVKNASDDKTIGMFSTHVDDILDGGNKMFIDAFRMMLDKRFDKVKFEAVVNVFDAAVGAVTLPVSLNDCDAITFTSNLVSAPLVNPPRPNNSESADELTVPVPVEFESKSIL